MRREQRSQQSGAAINAARTFLRAGDVRAAQTCVDLAARDPQRAAQVAELQELIKKMPGRPR
jgi:thioredoxin-like negative regulator of GroEL